MIDMSLNTLSLGEAALRIVCVCIIGFFLGYDRECKDKPIGLQSYMIIGVASCLLAIMSQELHDKYQTAEGMLLSLDLGKIISGVLTGIGFLGAGAIIKRDGDTVIGTATGASIWAAGALGLAIGYGLYIIGLFGFISVWAILVIIPKCLKT